MVIMYFDINKGVYIKMLNKIKEFFSKMKNDEHSLFEIIMFSISGVVSVVVLVCAIMLGNFMFSKQDTVTDQ